MSGINIDPQAYGFRDDGTESGRIRTEIVSGDLVMVPLTAGTFQVVGTGSNSVTVIETDILNPDKSGQAATLLRKAGTQQTIYIQTCVYGRTVGVRYLRDANTPPFTVIIDGEAFQVSDVNPTYNGIVAAYTDPWGFTVLARDLHPGRHDVRVQVDPAATDKTLRLYGFLAERAAGYIDPPANGGFLVSSALTTSDGEVFRNKGGLQHVFVSKIMYYNSDTVSRTVTFKQGSTVVWKKLIAAGAVEELNFGFPIGLVSVFHSADAAGVVIPTTVWGVN